MPSDEENKNQPDNEKSRIDELEARLRQATNDISKAKETIEKEMQKRKDIEQTLKAIEQEKIGVFNSMAEHVVYHDKNMKIVWANRAAASSVGMKPDELVGMNCYELWQKRSTICDNCPVDRALRTGEPHEMEMTSPDGRSWFLHGYPVKNDKGEVIGAAEVTMDLTVIKQAEYVIKESEKQLRTIFDSANDAMFIHDLKGNFLEVNETACKRLGYTREEFLKMTSMSIDSSEYAILVMKRIEELREKGPKFFETAHVTKGGRVIPIELSSRIIDYQGKPAVLSIARDITDRKQAECAQRESERKYKTLVDAIPDAVIVCDLEGNITLISEQTSMVTGYQIEDLIGKNGLFLVHPEDRHRARENIQKTFERGHSRTEYRLLKPDGTVYSVEVNAAVMEDDQGKPRSFLVSARDITQRKHIEDALRLSEIRYRSIYDRSLLCVYIHDFDGNVLDANNAALDLLGYSREELPNLNIANFLDADQLPVVHQIIEEIRTTGFQKEPAEYRLLHKNGTYVWVETEGTLLHKGGKPYAIQGIARDITKRVITLAALRDSEQKYKTITENVNIGIYRNTVGPKGKFIEANPAIVKMFGHDSKEQFLKIDVSELYQIPGDRNRFNEKMLTYGYVKDEILQLKKKDGTPFFASVSAVAVKDENGQTQYYDGIIDDITDRIKAEQDLKDSYLKLKTVLNGTVNALASTTEKRDPYTAGHQHRVTQLAAAIAAEMGLADDQIDGIKVAGIVHDIGKIHVAAEILNKPIVLNDIEMALVKTHCRAGYEILKTIEFPWDVAEIVLQHHERINGSGYPRGLNGEEILLEAKILAVADVVEAMVSHRPYRAALSTDKALEEISLNRGVLYSEDVVDVCLRLFGRGFQFK